MYDGTDNYGMETRATAQDNMGRCRYLQWFVEQNSNVQFFFSFPEAEKVPIVVSNVHYCTHEQLLSNLEE